MKTYRRVDIYLHVVSFMPHPFYPLERARGTHCTGVWVSPKAGVDAVKKRKIIPLPGIEPRQSSP
jgi:hypothetical protein